MPKGYHGESCAEAIRDSLKPGEVATFSTLYQRVRERGAWNEDSICQDLMACVVNLPPARHHWKSTAPFLLLHLDGTYELYRPGVHPRVRV